MSSQQSIYKVTLQLIADILSYENSIEELEKKIKSGTIDWEQFVIIASDFLVLTTCYSRLKEKQLLKLIPEDLALYLQEITTINRNRNNSLLKEIIHISDKLTKNNINHVFLKGSAFLVKNLYNDPGARMLGDIDILVDEMQIDQAYKLLLNNGYKETKRGISSKYFDYKHLPRLQSDTYMAAVEVHRKVTLTVYNGLLEPKAILSNKVCVQNIYVPSNEHLLLHSILNFQANDLGYNYSKISMKSIYDVLILRNTYNFDFEETFKLPYFKNYFSIAQLFFEDFRIFKTNTLVNTMFLLKLKYPLFKRIIDAIIKKTTYIKVIITSRILFFLKNKDYRNDIINDYKSILGLRKLKKS